LTGKEFDVHAKVVINAAGPFCDEVRKMADKNAPQIISPSSGVHVVLPDYYSPDHMGLIVPKTKDGRVVFMLPWLGRTVAGTTDSATNLTMLPEANEEEIEFILDAISDYLVVKVSSCKPEACTAEDFFIKVLVVQKILIYVCSKLWWLVTTIHGAV
jgi:glycerol-3-phosphate dehydrogenase